MNVGYNERLFFFFFKDYHAFEREVLDHETKSWLQTKFGHKMPLSQTFRAHTFLIPSPRINWQRTHILGG